MTFGIQLFAGACVVVLISGVIVALNLFGLPMTLPGWGVVFACVWAISFVCMRRQWYAMLVSMLLTGLVLYAVILTFLPPAAGHGH